MGGPPPETESGRPVSATAHITRQIRTAAASLKESPDRPTRTIVDDRDGELTCQPRLFRRSESREARSRRKPSRLVLQNCRRAVPFQATLAKPDQDRPVARMLEHAVVEQSLQLNADAVILAHNHFGPGRAFAFRRVPKADVEERAAVGRRVCARSPGGNRRRRGQFRGTRASLARAHGDGRLPPHSSL